jgi:NAD(P)-dependent dehydrogenase (short-subunit alcohol dehydrogenase family)
LAEQGVKVAINYYRNEVAANDAVSKIRGLGSDGFTVQGDVCSPDDIVRMFSRAKQEFETLDILIANARPEVSAFYQSPKAITLESWQTAVDSQARAFLIGAREASALLREGGRIIAITYAKAMSGTRSAPRFAIVIDSDFGKASDCVSVHLLTKGLFSDPVLLLPVTRRKPLAGW